MDVQIRTKKPVVLKSFTLVYGKNQKALLECHEQCLKTDTESVLEKKRS